jgi:NAD+ synthase
MSEQTIPNHPQQWAVALVDFIRQTFLTAHKSKAVIAVSGGIDSAVSLRLLTSALGGESVFGILLPYKNQDMSDGQLVLDHVGVPKQQQITIQIEPIVVVAAEQLSLDHSSASNALDRVRLGNLMARSRMMLVYDLARQHNALVCGTENKSEHYLGYFTRFGDAASDLEPLSNLYKTQIRSLAQHLELPAVFWQKAPSAGLWAGQTDEAELGFSYQQADVVLHQLIDLKRAPADISTITGIEQTVIAAVMSQVQASAFKLVVPYSPGEITT